MRSIAISVQCLHCVHILVDDVMDWTIVFNFTCLLTYLLAFLLIYLCV